MDIVKRDDASFQAADDGEEVFVIRDDESKSFFGVDYASWLGTVIHMHWPCLIESDGIMTELTR